MSLTLPGFSPQRELGQFYSQWTLNSSYVFQQALTGSPTSATPSLAQAFFIASLFIKSQSELQGYFPGGINGNLVQPSTYLFFHS